MFPKTHSINQGLRAEKSLISHLFKLNAQLAFLTGQNYWLIL